MLLKVIACEIAFREICFAAAHSRNLIDLEFVTQGHHDVPCSGREDIQRRIEEVPEGRYNSILLGYGLCSQILVGLKAHHTQLVIPRAHDCITFFLGSKERYQKFFANHPGTYYYTSGWIECRRRRGEELSQDALHSPPTLFGAKSAYDQWVAKYGEEKAKYLLEIMGQWTAHYTHGALIEFDFTRHLGLRQQVQKICEEHNWQYEEIAGDLRLLQHWLDGYWSAEEFLVVRPGEQVVATFDDGIVGVKSAAAAAA